ncbi:MAG TPA: cytochrome c biogenesis protein CcsA [Prosthecobacter sp.]|nr:cytochrome c biogenesis protein CcsA [Prosthecobacter sp.]
MPSALILLVFSTLLFIGGVAPAIKALRTGHFRKKSWQWVPMLIGFALQTASIYLRGEEVHQCPMKSLSDVLVFIAWSVVLLYFLVGPSFHVSLLGIFTAPLVAGLQIIAILMPGAFPPYPTRPVDPWVELHIAVSLIAYAAFALACITGVMYLLQERFLKRHQITTLFYQLPPIQGLAKVIARLVWLGVFLLSIGLAISFKIDLPVGNSKLIVAWVVWGLYLVIGLIMARQALSPRQVAWFASVGFAVPLISLWLVTTHA